MTMISASFLGKASTLAVLILGIDGFALPPSTRQTQGQANIIRLSGSGSDYDGVEKARKQLLQAWDDEKPKDVSQQLSAKKLIRMITDADTADFDNILPPPPPLTTAERDRRLTELKLLEQLASGDEAAQHLMQFWSTERGPAAQERLEHAAEMLEAGQVIAAENMLMKLIDDYSIFPWVEPLSQLATVYFRQGKFEESYQLCVCVLHLKPWHVGALEGIVTACMRLCDRDQARNWAKKGLPKLIASTSFPPFATTGPANPKRAEWEIFRSV